VDDLANNPRFRTETESASILSSWQLAVGMKGNAFDAQKRLFELNITAFHVIPLLTRKKLSGSLSPFEGGL
jgi:hypothetical protein